MVDDTLVQELAAADVPKGWELEQPEDCSVRIQKNTAAPKVCVEDKRDNLTQYNFSVAVMTCDGNSPESKLQKYSLKFYSVDSVVEYAVTVVRRIETTGLR